MADQTPSAARAIEAEVAEGIAYLRKMDPCERVRVMDVFCISCGEYDPHAKCQCEKDR